MSDNSPATKLEFTIYNLPFRLRAPAEEHERLRRAAKHVDELMRQLSNSQVTTDSAKLALQAAVLSTVEYYKVLDDGATVIGLTEDVRQRIDNLIAQLEEELADL